MCFFCLLPPPPSLLPYSRLDRVTTPVTTGKFSLTHTYTHTHTAWGRMAELFGATAQGTREPAAAAVRGHRSKNKIKNNPGMESAPSRSVVLHVAATTRPWAPPAAVTGEKREIRSSIVLLPWLFSTLPALRMVRFRQRPVLFGDDACGWKKLGPFFLGRSAAIEN